MSVPFTPCFPSVSDIHRHDMTWRIYLGEGFGYDQEDGAEVCGRESPDDPHPTSLVLPQLRTVTVVVHEGTPTDG